MLREYPFLADPLEYAIKVAGSVKGVGIVFSDERIRGLALRRIELSLRGEGLPRYMGGTTEDEVFSFWLSVAAAIASGSQRILSSLVDAEIERARRMLAREPPHSLIAVASRLGLKVVRRRVELPWLYVEGRIVMKTLDLAVPLNQYLKYSPPGGREEWALTNSLVRGGLVFLEARKIVELSLEAARRRIRSEGARVAELGIPAVKELASEAIEAARRVELESYPTPSESSECIREVIEKLKAGEAGDESIYVLLSFMASAGFPPEIMEKAILEAGIASGDEAKNIALSLSKLGEHFYPYKCEVLREKGICKCDHDILSSALSRRSLT